MVRKDKLKNLSKVAKVAIKEPLLTRDKIAEKAWVSQWTASNMLKELDESWRKDDRIIWITNKDLEIVKLWQDIIKSRLKDKEEVSKMRTVEVSQVIRENTQRYTLFKWDITDKNGGLKNIDSIEIV